MRRLVLFDIDGTLILTGGAGSRAMGRAFSELFGVEDAFTGIPMAGRTDAVILADAFTRAGLVASADRVRAFHRLYCRQLREEIERPSSAKRAMPGVRRILDELSAREDVVLGLLTGNIAEGARIKLEHFDLWRYFKCGAFGDETHDRNTLVPVALSEARACGVAPNDLRHVIVVGDTPLDIACARAGGALAVAVATGGHDARSLEESGADYVFDDLSDADRFLAIVDDAGIRGSGLGIRV